MQDSGRFSEPDIQRAIGEIEQNTGSKQIGVCVQGVLTAIQTASQDQDRAGRFAEVLAEAVSEGGL